MAEDCEVFGFKLKFQCFFWLTIDSSQSSTSHLCHSDGDSSRRCASKRLSSFVLTSPINFTNYINDVSTSTDDIQLLVFHKLRLPTPVRVSSAHRAFNLRRHGSRNRDIWQRKETSSCPYKKPFVFKGNLHKSSKFKTRRPCAVFGRNKLLRFK